MTQAGQTYDSVPVHVERHDDQGVYKIGVIIDSAFIPVFAIKTGDVDEAVQRAREQLDAEQQQPEQQQQPPAA